VGDHQIVGTTPDFRISRSAVIKVRPSANAVAAIIRSAGSLKYFWGNANALAADFARSSAGSKTYFPRRTKKIPHDTLRRDAFLAGKHGQFHQSHV
jgi:hypothetical protein